MCNDDDVQAPCTAAASPETWVSWATETLLPDNDVVVTKLKIGNSIFGNVHQCNQHFFTAELINVKSDARMFFITIFPFFHSFQPPNLRSLSVRSRALFFNANPNWCRTRRPEQYEKKIFNFDFNFSLIFITLIYLSHTNHIHIFPYSSPLAFWRRW